MYSCGEVGKRCGDEVLVHVPLKLHEQASDTSSGVRIRSGDVIGTLKEINQACLQYRREGVRRTVCKVKSVSFVDRDLLK